MKTYTAYRLDTGEIVQSGSGLRVPQFGEGIAVLEGFVDFRPGCGYRVVDGRVVETTVAVTVDEARRREYPGTGEQLDALWKLVDALLAQSPPPADAMAVRDAVRDVKARHPKGSPT